jgi:predicted alpha/beta hydrolase family esterase
MQAKNQLILIGGGEVFRSDAEALDWLEKCDRDLMARQPSWKKWIADGLSEHCQIIRPDMPNTMNAKYAEWKVWFEKYFRYITEAQAIEKSTLDRVMEKDKTQNQGKLILVGNSLGATFLVKYLSENLFPRHIDALHLISPAYDDAGLIDESLATFQFVPRALEHLHHQTKHIHIWSSTDDGVVPYDHSVRFHVNLVGSTLHTFHDRGHFVGQSHFVELFQEILKTLS